VLRDSPVLRFTSNITYLHTSPSEIDTRSYTDASHHNVTTRMGNDPHEGVVDTNYKVHGVDNLFRRESTVFPTCGYANPTWTIVTLALRLAEHLQKRRF
jgi:choline dehydrogenase-like flavoprotein